MLSPGTVFASDFRVRSQLASGGMGSVYEVEQLSTGRLRALKLMHPDLVTDPKLRARFSLEAQIGSKIGSEHIVEVVAAGVDAESGAPYLVMELLAGETLAARLERGPLSRDEAAELFVQIAHGMGAAHAASIVHRDLKPENLFLALARRAGASFVVKVLDLGVAKVLVDSNTMRTAALGTPLWMAPEQTELRATITPAADVWALGLIAFRCLTGKSYWLSASANSGVESIMREVLFDAMEPASVRAATLGAIEPPPGFDPWFAKATARVPAERYPDANVALADLDAILKPAGMTPTVDAAPFAEPAPLRPRDIIQPPPVKKADKSAAIPLLIGGLLFLGSVAITIQLTSPPSKRRTHVDDDEPSRPARSSVVTTARPVAPPPPATNVDSAPPVDPAFGAPPDVASPPADAIRTPSGLAYKNLVHGSGTTHPLATEKVKVHYTGWTRDGKMFDSSRKAGKPATFPLDGVIKGWTEGVQLMVVGEKTRFWIPGELAYGDTPSRAGAPAGQLTFDIELLEIVGGPAAPADVATPPPDAKRTPSGLYYKILAHGGSSRRPVATDTVSVHYTGWTRDGKMFDSSVKRGTPASFPLKNVIKGWTEGLQLMSVGDKARFWIPPALAYGETPTGGRPAGQLTFDVELLDIVTK